MSTRGMFICWICLLGSMQPAIAETLSVLSIGKITMNAERQLPLITAKVAGIATSLVIDTGAHPIILTTHFAEKIGLDKKVVPTPSEPLVFLNNQHIPFTLGPAESTLTHVAVIQKQDDFYQRAGIGGIYNPNLLHCENCITVIDFINMELYLAHADEIDTVLKGLDEHYSGIARISTPYLDSDTSMLYIAGVSVNHQPAETVLLDTGTNATSFTEASVGNNVIIAHPSHAMDITGHLFNTKTTIPMTVSINAIEVAKIPVWIEDSLRAVTNEDWQEMERQGDIGMDILKNCAMAIEKPKAVHFYCRPPSTL